jgi:hypothetical protein
MKSVRASLGIESAKVNRAVQREVNAVVFAYAYREYGLSPAQVQEAGKRMTAQTKRDRCAKTIKEVTSWRDLRG